MYHGFRFWVCTALYCASKGWKCSADKELKSESNFYVLFDAYKLW